MKALLKELKMKKRIADIRSELDIHVDKDMKVHAKSSYTMAEQEAVVVPS